MELTLGPLRQVSQHAADLDRATSFYGNTLGLRLIARFGALAFFDMAGTRLFLEENAKGDPTETVLYFAVDDIHAARASLEAKGVGFEGDTHVIHRDTDGTFGPAGEDEWMTFFRDSEGNLLALSSRERPA